MLLLTTALVTAAVICPAALPAASPDCCSSALPRFTARAPSGVEAAGIVEVQ
jgi:hypothetical protein